MTDVVLPIPGNPWIRGYRIHTYFFCIMMRDCPDFYKYIISNYLCLHNKRSGVDYLDFHTENFFQRLGELFYDNSLFDYYRFDITPDVDREHIKHTIADGLKNGYYIIHAINEAHLRHTARYGGNLCNNLEMTYGFSESRNSFFVFDYDMHGRLGGTEVAEDEYIKAISTVKVERNCLNFVKAKKGLFFEFDDKKATGLLRCHICSKPAYPDYIAYYGNLIGYEAIDRTLSVTKENGVDFIKIRIIKEHKNMILRYFGYICDNFAVPHSFFERYAEISEAMDNIFLCMFKDSMSDMKNSNTSKRINSISKLNEREQKLLAEYLEYRGR